MKSCKVTTEVTADQCSHSYAVTHMQSPICSHSYAVSHSERQIYNHRAPGIDRTVQTPSSFSNCTWGKEVKQSIIESMRVNDGIMMASVQCCAADLSFLPKTNPVFMLYAKMFCRYFSIALQLLMLGAIWTSDSNCVCRTKGIETK